MIFQRCKATEVLLPTLTVYFLRTNAVSLKGKMEYLKKAIIISSDSAINN